MVANWERVESEGWCRGVRVKIGLAQFTLDFLLLILPKLEGILRVSWLPTLGPINWDFANMSMGFKHEGQAITLKPAQKAIGIPSSRWLSIGSSTQADLHQILTEFREVLAEPKGLPPHRSCDHRIHLQEGTDPVVVRPYRYPHLTKDEIE